MATSARIALGFLSIYVLQYVWFASKITQDHSLNDVLSPVVRRTRIPDCDVNFLVVVRFRRGLTRLLLTLKRSSQTMSCCYKLGEAWKYDSCCSWP